MSQSVDKLLRNAQRHYQSGNIAQAEQIYKHILSRFPKNKKAIEGYEKLNAPSKLELANLIDLFNRGQFRETFKIGEQLREKFPRSAILYEILGAASLGLGNDFNTIKYYRGLLKINPKNTDALNNIGLVFYKKGDFKRAVENYQNAINLEPSFANAHFNLGNSLRELGDLRAAIKSYKKSININPNDAELLFMYGTSLKEYGFLEQAIVYYKKALEIKPDLENVKAELDQISVEIIEIQQLLSNSQKARKKDLKSAEVFFFKGTIYELKGYVESAIDFFDQAIKCKSDFIKAYFRITELLIKKGNFDLAIEKLNRALLCDPENSIFYYNLGFALKNMGKPDEATKNCEKAIEFAPDLAEAFDLLGLIQLENGDLEGALVNFKKAIKNQANFSEAHNNIGTIYSKKCEMGAAMMSHQTAVEINPKNAMYRFNIANVFNEIGDLDAAIKSYKEALNLQPDYDLAAWNLALALLKKEDFQNAWRNYDLRWRTLKGVGDFLPTGKPVWVPGAKQTVLLWAEQGIGDEIMFGSIIPDFHILCSKLIVQVDPRLIPMFRRSFHNDIDFRPRTEIISEKEYDSHIPVGSLPFYLRQNIKSFQSISQGWLHASKSKSNDLRSKLLADGSEILIGISWHSTNPREGAAAKVMSLYRLAKKLHRSKVKLVNLQYGDVGEEINNLKEKTNIEVVQLSEIDIKNDIDGLAALIEACDRIVSISNVTLHLAGALGKKAHGLLAFNGDWRWGQKPTSSYWYKSIQLHRQTEINNWDTVLDKL